MQAAEASMPVYQFQAAYTSQAWGAQVANPQNRIEAVGTIVQGMGGKILDAYLAFGEYDVVAIIELPSNIDAAAFSMAVSAGGAIKNLQTTPLMSIEDGIDAMRKAGQSGYQAPS
jgi:uncharacterized protein with GYD domain